MEAIVMRPVYTISKRDPSKLRVSKCNQYFDIYKKTVGKCRHYNYVNVYRAEYMDVDHELHSQR